MSNYTIDELRGFGFDDEQIAAINRVKVRLLSLKINRLRLQRS